MGVPAPSAGIEWIETEERFSELAQPWDELAELEGTPFSRHAWFEAWNRAFGQGQMRVLAVWDGDRLAAAMPLLAEGTSLGAMSNPEHTPLIRPLARDASGLQRLEAALFESPARTVSFACLPAPEGEALAQAARMAGRLATVSDELTSPIVDTDGDFDEWRELSKPRWSSPLERYRRKMHRDHEAEFELLRSPATLDQGFELGLELEAAGWKGAAGTAVISDPLTDEFYRSIAGSFAARGELSLSSITLDGRVVAFDYSLLYRKRLYLLKTAHDESMRRLAPGMVLRLSVIEHCFETDIEAHELLGGAEPYKLKFSTSERRHVKLRCYRRLPGEVLRYGYRQAIRPRLRTAYRTLRRSRARD